MGFSYVGMENDSLGNEIVYVHDDAARVVAGIDVLNSKSVD